MSTPYIGEIRTVGFNFTPQGWAACNGQLLRIDEYQALFTIVGTTYGGDGQTTFAVPNLNSRVVVGAGSGPGLSPYQVGRTGGVESVTLSTNQLPAHTHPFSGSVGGSTTGPLSDDPAGRRPGQPTGDRAYASTAPGGRTLAATGATGTFTLAGGSQPHPNIQPVLALNFIIATEGIYPSQS